MIADLINAAPWWAHGALAVFDLWLMVWAIGWVPLGGYRG